MGDLVRKVELVEWAAFIAVVAAATWWGSFVAKRAKQRNSAGSCGRCGAPLDGLTGDSRVFVGGPDKVRVLVCSRCRALIRRNYIAAAILGVFLLGLPLLLKL